MAGFAGPALATAVSAAGGLGFIGGRVSMADLRSQLQEASATFASSNNPTLKSSNTLPLGVGLLPFLLKLEDVVPVIEEFKPSVVWLFAAKELDDYAVWAAAMRKVSPESKVCVQVGSIAAALHVARTVQPDALCMQGADAGGHGFEKGAGIISLVPEAVDTLKREGFGHIPLLASGGIVDGRGVAAALALGASGVVMGTRFLASREVTVHPRYQDAILEAQDGGQATTRSKLFDELRGPNIWPGLYDGRSLIMRSYEDYQNGVDLDEIQRLHNEEEKGVDQGFAVGGKGRAAVWAGTGVGMVGEVEAAREIVERVRSETKGVLDRFTV